MDGASVCVQSSGPTAQFSRDSSSRKRLVVATAAYFCGGSLLSIIERQIDGVMFLMRLHRTREEPQNATQAGRPGPDDHFWPT